MPRFQDKVVIVTGSSNGIGRATAVLFAKEGAKVTITGRNATTLEETKNLILAAGSSEDRILSVIGDLTDDAFQHKIIDETVAKFGGINVLVNNAGGVAPDMTGALSFEQSIDVFDYVVRLNVRAIVNLIHYSKEHLKKAQGEIINISSIAGLNSAWTSAPYYASTKAALDQLTRAYAVQYIHDGIRVNGVNPGAILTNIMEKQGIQNMDEMFSFLVPEIPAGKIGEPQDIADAIAFLADRSVSSYIVGHSLVVDGGASLRNIFNNSLEAAKTE